MPELPEVETICRQLDKILTGQKIIGIQSASWRIEVKGKKVLGVRRKAKMIWIDLEGDANLLIHLKMTGQLLINGQEGKHTRQVIQLTKDKLIFNDLRKFGWIKFINNKKLTEIISKLPPDVVDSAFTPKYLQTVLGNSKRAVKLVLLDQQKIGGIGNIYANESLYCAGIDPRTLANKVKAIKKLHQCIKQVINKGIKFGGTTASDEKFVNIFGKAGKFQQFLKVYENKKNCYQCKSLIKKIKLGGRGTYFCPQCQR